MTGPAYINGLRRKVVVAEEAFAAIRDGHADPRAIAAAALDELAKGKSRGTATPLGYNWIMENINHDNREECLLWPFSLSSPGYGQFSYEGKVYLAHRYMCEVVWGTPPEADYQAAHSCGNRACCNPMHLGWKSPSDNQRDRQIHGTANKRATKITLAQAEEIKSLKGKEPPVQTAGRFGITESNVRLIQDGKTWKKERFKPPPLTEEQVRIIRRIGMSMSAQKIADMLGVGAAAVMNCRAGKSHKDVLPSSYQNT